MNLEWHSVPAVKVDARHGALGFSGAFFYGILCLFHFYGVRSSRMFFVWLSLREAYVLFRYVLSYSADDCI